MKIVIDPNEAKTSSLGEFYKTPMIHKNCVSVEVEVKEQQKSRWCWAAIASALGAYYDTLHLDQSAIAETLLRTFDNDKGAYTEEEVREGNVNFKLDEALKYVRCFSHWTIGKPLFERIQFEINQGRPLGVRLEWFKGGAHYVLVTGYDNENKSLLVDDPLHGKSKQQFDKFPEDYRECGAVWTETFWTTKQK